MARLIGGIPYDILSVLMGSLSVNFINYIISGLIAISPDIILSQMMGASIDDPTSPAFIISICIKVFKILISIIIVRLITKNKKTDEINSQPAENIGSSASESEPTVEENTVTEDNGNLIS